MQMIRSSRALRFAGPDCSARRNRRTLAATIVAAVLIALMVGPVAMAADNPGTGDAGFFTFVPSDAPAGTQVNVASGNLMTSTRDLADSVANYDVVVDRFYNSLTAASFSILSPRWSFAVGPTTKLTSVTGGVRIDGPSGYSVTVSSQGDGTYLCRPASMAPSPEAVRDGR